MKFTDKTVTQSKPELPDGMTDKIFFDERLRGFGLRVREGAKIKVWIYQYSLHNKTQRMTIGTWPAMTPGEAYERARKLAADRAAGGNPAHDKQVLQADKETFAAVVALYLQAKRPELRDRTYSECERYLTGSARSLNVLPLAAITQAEIADLLDRVAKDSGDATSNRLRANLAALFTWAMQRGKVSVNPVALTAKRKEQSRDRVLSDAELAAIWQACPEGDFGNIVKLLMLTGQRRAEIGGLRWSEIDLRQGRIDLPAERTKNGHAHFVPLAEPVRAILSAQPHIRDHVFGRGDSADGFAGWSAAKAALDASLPKMQAWTLHDLRRTMATGMGELGVQPHIIEAAINHRSGHKAGVAGTYNRANYHAERRAALDKWAAHIAALISKPKAVAKAGASASPRPHKAAA
jgi:integrase